MERETKVNYLPDGFFPGRCPCCDMVIPIPCESAKVFCCYCGSSFLSKAAIRLYSCKDRTEFSLDHQRGLEKADKGQELAKNSSDAYAQRFLTIRQMSKATGISEYLIRRLVKQGKLPAFYSGNKALLNYTKVCEILGVMSD